MLKKQYNYLIVLPRFITSSSESYLIPLGVLYISGAMKAAGFNVFTINLNHFSNPYEKLRSMIADNDIEIVVSGGTSPLYSQVRAIYDCARSTDNDIITICGGGIITGDPEAAMEALEIVDYGVIGEGEETICELCHTIETHSDPTRVNGIIYKEGSCLKRTEKRREIKDIDNLPWPDYEGFDYKTYLEKHSSFSLADMDFKKNLSIICSRSCPFNCTFCFHTSGSIYRQRSLDSVFAEIEYFTGKYDIKILLVMDELFASSYERVKEFCERIKVYDLKWICYLRVDGITEGILQLLKDANCCTINVGLESANNKVLKSMRKNITVEKIEVARDKLIKYGFSLVGSFIFGDIAETVQTAQSTLDWWKKYKHNSIELVMIRVFPGAFLYEYAVKNGIITDKVKFLREGCPYVNVSKMTDSQMGELIQSISMIKMDAQKTIEDYKVMTFDSQTNTFHIAWKCPECSNQNISSNVTVFIPHFIKCQSCLREYTPTLPQEIVEQIDLNILNLSGDKRKIGLWGIGVYTLDFLSRSETVKQDNIFLIDISRFKQKIGFKDKRIYPPDIIREKGISSVIILIPAYTGSIDAQINNEYSGVDIYSIYDLFVPRL